MDFLGFIFTPAGIVALYAGAVFGGVTAGFVAVVFSTFLGRRS